MRELTFRPSVPVRVAFALLFLMLALMIAADLKDLPPRGLHDYFVIALAGACLYAAITYPMRAIVFKEGAVRTRTLGRWSAKPLPPKVRVRPGLSLGSVYLVDDATGNVIVVLKREFGPVASLEARTKAWLRGENRLAEAAGPPSPSA